ncbi:MAG: response regulator transcription factor [Saprospiraceae bacterium]|nr:response regulator transcription factor [Saprospiraceae bacterium]
MNILIIEDEIPAAKQLTKMVAKCEPQARVLDTLDSVEGAVRWLATFPAPDLIFMDIQIADGLSFDIFSRCEVTAPVIFTTAFDQYAVQAFKVNAVDYLLKPIDPDDLKTALERHRDRRQTAPAVDLQQLSRFFHPSTSYKERFLVKNGQQLSFVLSQEIAYFLSSDGLTQAFTEGGKKHFIDHTLEELERLLDPRHFFRISRGMTVRLEAIRKIHPHLNGRLKLELHPSPGDEVFVSRERAGEFKTWLGG